MLFIDVVIYLNIRFTTTSVFYLIAPRPSTFCAIVLNYTDYRLQDF